MLALEINIGPFWHIVHYYICQQIIKHATVFNTYLEEVVFETVGL